MKRTTVKIVAGILVLIAAIIAVAVVRTGGRDKRYAYHFETAPDISASAVHDHLIVSLARSYVVEPRPYRQDAGAKVVNFDLMDVWDLGYYLYGIDYLTTTRMLKTITREGYADDYLLDYYCACACVTRALYPEDFMGNNIYQKFGEQDYSYDFWMDELGIANHSYRALRDALLDFRYINQVNGMVVPWEYIYYSETYGIYVWNP